MPVNFLSTTQRERYGCYPDILSSEELARYFHLDDDDREWITTKRRDSNRLGYVLRRNGQINICFDLYVLVDIYRCYGTIPFMDTITSIEKLLQMASTQGLVRSNDLVPLGIPRVCLTRAVRRGQLERIGRGMYCLPGRSVSAHGVLAEVARRVPKGVVCLLSALRFHDLTTQAPFEVWLAIDNKAAAPRLDYPPLRLVRFSGAALTVGVEEHIIDGTSVRLTSVAKTVADCFKYRNKIGLDVALEALREAWAARRMSADEIWHHAKIDRVANVMRPYLESLV